MRNSLDYAGLAQLCARSPIMRKIMRAHNRIIQPSLLEALYFLVVNLSVCTCVLGQRYSNWLAVNLWLFLIRMCSWFYWKWNYVVLPVFTCLWENYFLCNFEQTVSTESYLLVTFVWGFGVHCGWHFIFWCVVSVISFFSKFVAQKRSQLFSVTFHWFMDFNAVFTV